MIFTIEGNNYKENCLPSYNDYITQCRYNKYSANNFKKKFEKIIASQINKKFYINKPFTLNLKIYEGNNRRDKDNVESFAKKLILDTLQHYNYIKNDKLYQGGTTIFLYDKNNSHITVEIKIE